MTLVSELNRLAGTVQRPAQGAANAWAGTTNLSLVGALNSKAGTTGLGLLGVLNKLAGTSGVGPDIALVNVTNGVTPTVRATASAGTTTTAGTLNVTVPASCTNGDLILVFFDDPNTITYTTPGGYTAGTINNSSGSQRQQFFYKTASGDANATVTLTPSTGTDGLVAIVVLITQGTWDTSTTFNPVLPAAITFNGNSTSLTTTTVTTTKSNDLTILYAGITRANTTAPSFTTPGGWTANVAQFGHNGTNGIHGAIFTQVQVSPGATPSPTLTSTLAGAGQCMVFSIKGFGT